MVAEPMGPLDYLDSCSSGSSYSDGSFLPDDRDVTIESSSSFAYFNDWMDSHYFDQYAIDDQV
jgi:hypothetical protein